MFHDAVEGNGYLNQAAMDHVLLISTGPTFMNCVFDTQLRACPDLPSTHATAPLIDPLYPLPLSSAAAVPLPSFIAQWACADGGVTGPLRTTMLSNEMSSGLPEE